MDKLRDNRGLTLVELIVAMAMSTIIFGAATLFLNNAIKSYNTASATIDLQMESQIMMEQVGTWIMEGNRTEVIAVTDAITGETADVLVIYNIPRLVEHSKWPVGFETLPDRPTTVGTMRVIWKKDDKLYMVCENDTDYLFGTVNATVTPDYSSAAYQNAVAAYPSMPFSEATKENFFLAYVNTASAPVNCVSEYVDTFTATKSQIRLSSSSGDGTPSANLIYNEKITINLVLKELMQEFALTNEFKVRNEVFQ